MSLSRADVRKLLKYEFLRGANAPTAVDRINKAHGPGSVSRTTAFDWFAKFKKGNMGVEDQKRSGRPKTVDWTGVVNAIDEDPTLDLRSLAGLFGCSRSEILKILRAEGKKWMKGRWVPHELTNGQKQKRLQEAKKLRRRQLRRPFLNSVITCDEKWVPLVNRERRNEWLSPGQRRSGTPNPDFRASKVMLCVWWDRRGPIHWELMPKGQTITAQVYCEQLERVRQKLRNRRIPVILLHDNAKPHTAQLTCDKLAEMGWEVLPHPPYSPDISPTDFHLFRSLEHWIRGKKFENRDEVEACVKEFFASKSRAWYARGIGQLEERWEQIIKSRGEYFL